MLAGTCNLQYLNGLADSTYHKQYTPSWGTIYPHSSEKNVRVGNAMFANSFLIIGIAGSKPGVFRPLAAFPDMMSMG